MNFNERLKSIRSSKGISQVDLAQKCGFVQQVISRYESGAVGPTADNLIKLCEVLECSSDYLLGISDDIGYISPKELEALKDFNKEFDLLELVKKGKPRIDGFQLNDNMKERIGDALELVYKMELKKLNK